MLKPILLSTFLLSINFLIAQTWEDMTSLPGGVLDARHHPVTFSVGDYGYVLTGSVNGVAERDFMRYSASTDSWQSLPNFPGEARSYSYGSARGTKAYIGFGGNDNTAFNDLWEYDTETEQWTQLADCPCDGRLHPAFVQLDDKIYVGMGNNPTNLKDWWEYDIPTNSWTQKDDLPGPSRHHPFYFGVDGVAYVGFGHGNTMGGSLSIYNDFYQFDPSTDQWTRLNDFPGEGRVAGTQFDYNGKGYIMSGDGDDHSFMAEGEFWEYTPETDSWLQLMSHPGSSRWAPGSFVIDNYVYLTCGLSFTRLENDLIRFQLAPLSSTTDEITATPIAVFPNPAKDVISVNQDISQFSEVRLMNNHGQVVKMISSNTVSLNDLSNGIYYLQFVKDKLVHTEKVIIAR